MLDSIRLECSFPLPDLVDSHKYKALIHIRRSMQRLPQERWLGVSRLRQHFELRMRLRSSTSRCVAPFQIDCAVAKHYVPLMSALDTLTTSRNFRDTTGCVHWSSCRDAMLTRGQCLPKNVTSRQSFSYGWLTLCCSNPERRVVGYTTRQPHVRTMIDEMKKWRGYCRHKSGDWHSWPCCGWATLRQTSREPR